MILYLLIRRQGGEVLVPQALCLTEERAKDITIDGSYFILPVEADRLYSTLLDSGLPGAMAYDKEGLGTLIQQARQALGNLESRIRTLQASITELNDRIETLESAG